MINTLFLNNIPHYDLMMWVFMLVVILVIIQAFKLYLTMRKDFDITITKKIKLPTIIKTKKDKKDNKDGIAK